MASRESLYIPRTECYRNHEAEREYREMVNARLEKIEDALGRIEGTFARVWDAISPVVIKIAQAQGAVKFIVWGIGILIALAGIAVTVIKTFGFHK